MDIACTHYTQIYWYLLICTHTLIYIHTNICVFTHAWKTNYTYIYTYIHRFSYITNPDDVYIHIYTHTYIHMYNYIRISRVFSVYFLDIFRFFQPKTIQPVFQVDTSPRTGGLELLTVTCRQCFNRGPGGYSDYLTPVWSTL